MGIIDNYKELECFIASKLLLPSEEQTLKDLFRTDAVFGGKSIKEIQIANEIIQKADQREAQELLFKAAIVQLFKNCSDMDEEKKEKYQALIKLFSHQHALYQRVVQCVQNLLVNGGYLVRDSGIEYTVSFSFNTCGLSFQEFFSIKELLPLSGEEKIKQGSNLLTGDALFQIKLTDQQRKGMEIPQAEFELQSSVLYCKDPALIEILNQKAIFRKQENSASELLPKTSKLGPTGFKSFRKIKTFFSRSSSSHPASSLEEPSLSTGAKLSYEH